MPQVRRRLLRLRTGPDFRPQFKRADVDANGALTRDEFVTVS